MRTYSFFLIFLAVALMIDPEIIVAQKLTADDRLRSVANRLEALHVIGFDHSIELNYASDGFQHTMSTHGYIEFGVDNPLGVRFRFENPSTVYAYNGSESFLYDKSRNKLGVEVQPDFSNLSGLYFEGSLYTLRRALPTLLDNDSVETSILSDNDYDASSLHIEILMPRSTKIAYDGGLSPIPSDIVVKYVLKVDKQTLLPVEITKQDPNGDYMRTTLTSFDLDPMPPSDEAWYYSSLTDENTQDMYDQSVGPLIEVGKPAPDWTLSTFRKGKEVALRDFRGRNVLLVFWISHCGYSIAAVPTVNALFEEYADGRLAVISINPYDSPKVIDLFIEKHGPQYPILEQGQEVANAYGVPGYPVAVLIDQEGMIAYSGQVDENELHKSIEQLARK